MNQEVETITQLLYKNVNTAIVSNIDLAYYYQVIPLLGSWQDYIENSSIVYGITKNRLLEIAENHIETCVFFRGANKKGFQLIDVLTGLVKKEFFGFSILPNNSKEVNFSEFDGIKFKLY